MIVLTAISLPFMLRAPVDLPLILSVELIQITDITSIPFAAKAAKTLEEIKKKKEERVVSEQAPPAEKKKEKPDRIPLPEDLNKEKIQIVKKKQNPKEVEEILFYGNQNVNTLYGPFYAGINNILYFEIQGWTNHADITDKQKRVDKDLKLMEEIKINYSCYIIELMHPYRYIYYLMIHE